jgi:hypothetical protein
MTTAPMINMGRRRRMYRVCDSTDCRCSRRLSPVTLLYSSKCARWVSRISVRSLSVRLLSDIGVARSNVHAHRRARHRCLNKYGARARVRCGVLLESRFQDLVPYGDVVTAYFVMKSRNRLKTGFSEETFALGIAFTDGALKYAEAPRGRSAL